VNLEQCLRDVEMGQAGREHAEWLRKAHKCMKDRALGWEKSALLHTGFWVKARADAVKAAQECRDLQAEVERLTKLLDWDTSLTGKALLREGGE